MIFYWDERLTVIIDLTITIDICFPNHFINFGIGEFLAYVYEPLFRGGLKSESEMKTYRGWS